ncbi:spermidine/putrescine ABC transporter substrate-binding protein [Candidatus Albibeggiatoa sp. nov. NOAA]|uniref:polyamine ABC transporter substrate-binding protein n=1 Tax=Candidatus Albibeggiatoa sp. nov. NOAA TaxID=3162724 RepID=UPI003301360F|nr:spermidine/putrescine ABC transporter substrate-binding protein [Thiotrichaceae bacterium]
MLRRLLAVLLLPLTFSAMAEDATSSPTELVLYGWVDYIDDEVIAEFEQRFNAKLNLTYFESEDTRDRTLFRTGGKGYDVFIVTGKDIDIYQKRGWILPLGEEKIPNIKYVTPRWIDAWPSAKEYAVPYLWGTTGIIYRSDLVKEEITSWKQFFKPLPYLKDKITIFDEYRTVIGFALKTLGYPFNSEDKVHLKEAQKLLFTLKPYVQTYGAFDLEEDSGIVTGDVWMGLGWNGDALALQEFNDSIRYVIPKEGGEIWVDYFVVSSQSKVPELAIQFVNFMQEPRINAKNAETMSYAASNDKAKEFLSAEHLNNPVIYPDAEVLANSEFELALSSGRANRKQIMIWSKMTH